MENKIVLQFIKKDVDELSMLVDALMKEDKISKVLVDICLAKTQTLISEIKILNTESGFLPTNVIEQPEEIIKIVKVPFESKPDNITVSAPEIEVVKTCVDIDKGAGSISGPDQKIQQEETIIDDIEVDEPGPVVLNNVQVPVEELLEVVVEEAVKDEIVEEAPETIDHKETAIAVEVIEPTMPEVENINVDEESSSVVEKKILGELFSKEPSLNDKLSMNKNHENKIKARPISSIRSAIGINDRFLFTRELFSNDGALFEKSVSEIDNSGTYVNAIAYLEQNFKWSKTETSLKFIELIKRRFEN